MQYSESNDRAFALAQQAFEQMQKIGIAANPNNFTIWFHYFAGTYPDLKRTLDILLGNQEQFDETRNSEIFQKFFTLDQESATLHDATNRVNSELGRMLMVIRSADQGLAGLSNQLSLTDTELQKTDDPETLRRLGGALSHKIADVLTQTRVLEEQLEASNSELALLKEDVERMRREAMTDGLTGIANRKLFDLELRKSTMNAMANGEELALVLMDVDRFGQFNERFGHAVGDQVLKLVAVTIEECVKGQDTAARFGGDEFSIILPRTALNEAVSVAQNVARRVSSKNIINRATGERLGKVTMSGAVVSFKYGEPISQLMRRLGDVMTYASAKPNNTIASQDDL